MMKNQRKIAVDQKTASVMRRNEINLDLVNEKILRRSDRRSQDVIKAALVIRTEDEDQSHAMLKNAVKMIRSVLKVTEVAIERKQNHQIEGE